MQRGQHIAYTRGRAVEGWRSDRGDFLNMSIPTDNQRLVKHLRNDIEVGERVAQAMEFADFERNHR